jgi:hypothetical protein
MMASAVGAQAKLDFGNMATSFPPESLDVGSKVLLFDIFHTIQRLESRLQYQQDRLSVVEFSISNGGTSPTRSNSIASPASSFESEQRQETVTSGITPPQTPVEDYEASIHRMRRKFEFVDEEEVEIPEP